MREQSPYIQNKLRIARSTRLTLGIVAAVMTASAAIAQYAYDPSNADEQGPSGIRYFGSAKDNHGVLLPGATIELSSYQSNFVFTTDEQGRFRAKLPPESGPDKVVTKCWKAGFEVVQVTKRLGPTGVEPTVQIDCVLRLAVKKTA